jgi:hypothetical protein
MKFKFKFKLKWHNKRFNLDWWAFAAAQVSAAFVLFRNTFTKFAWLKLAGLSPAN